MILLVEMPVKDLQMFSASLRLRWLWLQWQDPSRPWHGLPLPSGEADLSLFNACSSVSIGNGSRARFWKDKWHDGMVLQDTFPELFALAKRKNLTVQQAIQNGRWMSGLQHINSAHLIDQFVSLWNISHATVLSSAEDTIRWDLNGDSYSVTTVYQACFLGRIHQPHLEAAWSIKAEGKVQFFMWLLLQNRLWTADRLEERGWPHEDRCTFCDQVLESANHLCLQCPFAKQVWLGIQSSHATIANIGIRSTTIRAWWKKASRFIKSKEKRQQTTMAAYVVWHLWKERNRRTFEHTTCSADGLVVQIRESVANVAQALGD